MAPESMHGMIRPNVRHLGVDGNGAIFSMSAAPSNGSIAGATTLPTEDQVDEPPPGTGANEDLIIVEVAQEFESISGASGSRSSEAVEAEVWYRDRS